ncbi:unnamed protein product [Angiostrongylus costaricensis]|uniref:ZM domain-containing protein n=1 Tax=Angiostrongylus costaricensis TaxID=334426 RepID=A0A0R3PW20_ANGCS|nr:unnamed protein product [Angiostrongylus costaricensis]
MKGQQRYDIKVDKRNAYGDESVTPSVYSGGAGAQSLLEETPVAVKQYAPVPDCRPTRPPAQPSGYRARRNSYGDEQVAPPVGAAAPSAYTPEQAPIAVKQYAQYAPASDCGPVKPPAQLSGYRARRNSYGDEQVTPPVGAAAPASYAPAEQAAEVIEHPGAASYQGRISPPARPSGY